MISLHMECKEKKPQIYTDTLNKLVVARGDVGLVGKMGEGGNLYGEGWN